MGNCSRKQNKTTEEGKGGKVSLFVIRTITQIINITHNCSPQGWGHSRSYHQDQHQPVGVCLGLAIERYRIKSSCLFVIEQNQSFNRYGIE